MAAKRKALGSSPLDRMSETIERVLSEPSSAQVAAPDSSPDAVNDQAQKRQGDEGAQAEAFIRARERAAVPSLSRRAAGIARVKLAARMRQRRRRLRPGTAPNTDLRALENGTAADAAAEENRRQPRSNSRKVGPNPLQSAARAAQRTGQKVWGTGSIATVIVLSLVIVFLIFAVRPATTANGQKATRLQLFAKAASGSANIAA